MQNVEGIPHMKVLIVDDESIIRRVLKRFFSAEVQAKKVQVQEAKDGREGWAMIEAAGGDFDLIFCDMTMPYLDGRQLFQRVEEAYPQLAARIIFQTGGTSHPDWLGTQSQPVLLKPFMPKDVEKSVRRIHPTIDFIRPQVRATPRQIT